MYVRKFDRRFADPFGCFSFYFASKPEYEMFRFVVARIYLFHVSLSLSLPFGVPLLFRCFYETATVAVAADATCEIGWTMSWWKTGCNGLVIFLWSPCRTIKRSCDDEARWSGENVDRFRAFPLAKFPFTAL